MTALAPDAIATAFRQACLAELAALKPGNVHRHAEGHGMRVTDFEAAAEAAAPAIADPALAVGARIRRAVEASLDRVGCNANLGILLLCAPLAAAAERAKPGGLRQSLAQVLAALTVEDAADAFAAIAAANPGGLGRAPAQDVACRPSVGLREAMALAAGRDRIARAYADGFAELFDFALPALREGRRLGLDLDLAVSRLHLLLLAREADSHIQRKFGEDTAEQARALASASLSRLDWRQKSPVLAELAALDARLKRDGFNPGTTADFVVAALFAERLEALLALDAEP